ncbi:hypothetical protein DSO57_1002385 [Entomophthora muscae]|uniref:Uncharacterized protein n=1 Tax=Entomophthora muscae TaxID=34485 RepID=A0ACC2RNQ9_9FUNG|nr:hypothetical protein DSO57_1002385 [Entomophthora muscae]
MIPNDLSNQTCDQCNRRRVKCSRQLPYCGQCTLRKEPCTYLRLIKRTPRKKEPMFDKATIVFQTSGSDLIKRSSPKKLTMLASPTKPLEKSLRHILIKMNVMPYKNLTAFLVTMLSFHSLGNSFNDELKALLKPFSDIAPYMKNARASPAAKLVVPSKPNKMILPYLQSQLRLTLNMSIQAFLYSIHKPLS